LWPAAPVLWMHDQVPGGGDRGYVVRADGSGRWKVDDDLSGKGEAPVDVSIGDLAISARPHHKQVCKGIHEQKTLTF
jgi:hypothetical protein